MSCERYFIEFPPQEPLTPESLLEESLALVNPKDIQLHRSVFFIPFEPFTPENQEKKRIWSRSQRKADKDAGAILRQNIRFMIKKTKHFGLLLSQLTWVGLMNFAEKRRVLQQIDDSLRAAALYIIMLKKETNGLTQFINCLHMTGNHEIANIIEAKLDLLELGIGNCEHFGHCSGIETSLDGWSQHCLPPKKRKTSADSGFDDTDDDEDDEEIESSLAPGREVCDGATRKYRCNIRPLDAIDVIAIINGKEDSRYKVELCKCGHYHQFPKWKDVTNENNNGGVAKENNNVCTSSSCPASSGFAKFFTRRSKSESRLSATQQQQQQPRQGILSPVPTPVEVGADLSHEEENMELITQPRCSHVRFSNIIQAQEAAAQVDSEADDAEDDGLTFRSKLPRFLRVFL